MGGVSTSVLSERLAGLERQGVLVRRKLPAPPPDEFYYADLIGLAVEFPDGTAVGTVRGVDNHGAGDVLDIAVEPAGPGGAVIAVPFTRAAVPTVDLAAGRVVVNPLPGLFAAADDGAAGQ
jgi:16S rRNA processing protein RimM